MEEEFNKQQQLWMEVLKAGDSHALCDELFRLLVKNSVKQQDIVLIQGGIRYHEKNFSLGSITYENCDQHCSKLRRALIRVVSELSVIDFEVEFVEKMKLVAKQKTEDYEAEMEFNDILGKDITDKEESDDPESENDSEPNPD